MNGDPDAHPATRLARYALALVPALALLWGVGTNAITLSLVGLCALGIIWNAWKTLARPRSPRPPPSHAP